MPISSQDVIIDNTPLPIEGGNATAVKTDGSAVTQPVSGTVGVNNFPATQPVSGTVAVSSVGGTVTVSGAVSTTPVTSSSATVTQTVSNSSNQTILAANPNRKKAILFFNTGVWFVKFGATASSTSFTYEVSSSNTTIEVTVWTGQIDVLCTTNGKLCNATELV